MTESINAIAGPSRSPTTRENEHITEGERPGSVDDHHHPSPSRQSTRTVRPLESDDEGLGDEDDKLRDTREYYGLSPINDPLSRHVSQSHKHKRTASMSTRYSSSSRAQSPDSRRPTSPSRVAMPIRLSKGFLSPKKPAAAVRYEREEKEREERRAGASTSQRAESRASVGTRVTSTGRKRAGSVEGGRSVDYDRGVDGRNDDHARLSPIQGDEYEGEGAANDGLPSGRTDDTAVTEGTGGTNDTRLLPSSESNLPTSMPSQTGIGFNDTLASRRSRVRESIADGSSHRGTHQGELSSDELFHRSSADLEKGGYLSPRIGDSTRNGGNGGAQRHTSQSKSSRYPPRPSFSQRISSLRSSRSSRSRAGGESKDGHTEHRVRTRRRYENFENPLSTWFCRGHLMTGGDAPWAVITISVLLFGITGVWIGTSGVWYWRYAGDYGMGAGAGVAIVIVFVYLFGLTTSSLLAASLRDPGIIPRDLDPSPTMLRDEGDSWDGPLDREFAVKAGRVTVRYCDTCRTYRPPRGSHCRLCGNCVDGIDHHCSYLHTCVGKRTYLSFLVLLVSGTTSAIYEVVFSAIHFSLVCHTDSISFREAVSRNPGAAVSFLLGVIVLPLMLFLLFYHVRLVIYNITTVEQIRASSASAWYRASTRPDNPFAEQSTIANILRATLARPQFPSWIGGWKEVREETRGVNPALREERWVKGGYERDER